MSSWADLDLDPKLKEIIAIEDTPDDLLLLPVAEIAYRTGLSEEQTCILLEKLGAARYSPNNGYFLEFASSITKLTIGDDEINQFLDGGLSTKGITEISGESATGKTQLALQLCLTAQLPLEVGGLNSNSLYICTEDAFPLKRLDQIIESFKLKYPNCDPVNADNVFIQHIGDLETLEVMILYHLENLVNSSNIGLVIIDSIASNFRVDDSSKIEHSNLIFRISQKLKQINEDFGVVIVCINQVTDNFQTFPAVEQESDIKITNFNFMPFYEIVPMDPKLWKVIPSLGLTWSNCVNTRIMLTRQDYAKSNIAEVNSFVKRTLYVIWSSDLTPKSLEYFIDSKGFHA